MAFMKSGGRLASCTLRAWCEQGFKCTKSGGWQWHCLMSLRYRNDHVELPWTMTTGDPLPSST
jgi:hypothetical protein